MLRAASAAAAGSCMSLAGANAAANGVAAVASLMLLLGLAGTEGHVAGRTSRRRVTCRPGSIGAVAASTAGQSTPRDASQVPQPWCCLPACCRWSKLSNLPMAAAASNCAHRRAPQACRAAGSSVVFAAAPGLSHRRQPFPLQAELLASPVMCLGPDLCCLTASCASLLQAASCKLIACVKHLTYAVLQPAALRSWLTSPARLPARSILRLPPSAKAIASPCGWYKTGIDGGLNCC